MGHGSRRRTLRFHAALLASKMTMAALRVARRAGGQLPGVVAESICPGFLGQLEQPKQMVMVTGTNGKTTTTNLIADLLVANGREVVTNRKGGNVAAGIASTLIRNATLTGRPQCETAVLELDERSARLVFPHITPDVLTITNLYRDTFTRNAHVWYVFDILSQAIPGESRLVLNADDLISARLAPENTHRSYYAIGRLPEDGAEREGIVSDLPACPDCGGHLTYEYVHLGHIGRATCDCCGRTNPAPQFELVDVDREASMITVREQGDVPSEQRYRISAGSITDLYNLLAAIGTARLLGLEPAEIARALEGGVGVVACRYSEVEARGRRLVRIASKGENGMACSRGFANIKREPGSKAVVLMLEDYYLAKDPTSTEFIGWLYETDFEYLNDPSIKQVVITDVRSEDMLLRVLLAGVDPQRVTCARDGLEAARVVDWRGTDAVFYSHAIHNEHVAEESREALRRLIEDEGEVA